jgi:hypothetical protein
MVFASMLRWPNRETPPSFSFLPPTPNPMKNHSNINSFLTLAEEIQDLQKAKDLLLSVWLADRVEGRLPLELIRKLDDYFELDEDE